jgi:hypothetical protein
MRIKFKILKNSRKSECRSRAIHHYQQEQAAVFVQRYQQPP